MTYFFEFIGNIINIFRKNTSFLNIWSGKKLAEKESWGFSHFCQRFQVKLSYLEHHIYNLSNNCPVLGR